MCHKKTQIRNLKIVVERVELMHFAGKCVTSRLQCAFCSVSTNYIICNASVCHRKILKIQNECTRHSADLVPVKQCCAESCFHGSVPKVALHPSPHGIAGVGCTKLWHLVENEGEGGAASDKWRRNGPSKDMQA